MEAAHCISCKKKFTQRWQHKFCSNKCQADDRYRVFVSQWLSGEIQVMTKNISAHIKRFLIEKNGAQCSICGWKQKHPVTQKVPIEVDHIDGSSENNNVKNVRLLCPNCHSLTSSFRNLNRGNGRVWRKKRTV